MTEPTDTQKPHDEGGVASVAHCSAFAGLPKWRMQELLDDYWRDKKEIGRLLGLRDELRGIHMMQEEVIIGIRRALRSDAPANEQLNQIQRELGMFEPNAEMRDGESRVSTTTTQP